LSANVHEADPLEYEIHTKGKDGRFPVKYRNLTGYCSDSGLLNESGRPMTWDEDSDAATVEEAKARAQAHFERRLAGIEVASPEDECAVSAPVPSG
jgi:hypothetical protein